MRVHLDKAVSDVVLKGILPLLQDVCFVVFMEDLNLQTLRPGNTKVYTTIKMYLYKTK